MKKKKKKLKRSKAEKILGVDMSLNGTAAVILQGGQMIDYWFFTSKKKLAQDPHAVFCKFAGPDKEQNHADRLHLIINWMMEMLTNNLIMISAFEDYAFAAKGRVFSIGELGGLMKYLFFVRNIPYRLYSPQSIKKFVTGSGGADKIQMVMRVMKRWGHDFTKYDEHSSDLADAFGTAKLLEMELKVRRGQIKLEDLPVKEREIFLSVSKTKPTNILARDFIKREVD